MEVVYVHGGMRREREGDEGEREERGERGEGGKDKRFFSELSNLVQAYGFPLTILHADDFSPSLSPSPSHSPSSSLSQTPSLEDEEEYRRLSHLRALIHHAEKERRDAILTDHCADQMARDVLYALSRGRGQSLMNEGGVTWKATVQDWKIGVPSDCAEAPSIENVTFIRMFCDSTQEEVNLFSEKEGISAKVKSIFPSSFGSSPNPKTTFGITEFFIASLQKEQRHTCHAILKCVSKMVLENEDKVGKEKKEERREKKG